MESASVNVTMAGAPPLIIFVLGMYLLVKTQASPTNSSQGRQHLEREPFANASQKITISITFQSEITFVILLMVLWPIKPTSWTLSDQGVLEVWSEAMSLFRF